MATSSRGPRYFQLGMKIKSVEKDEFIEDMLKGKDRQFEYLLR